MGSFFLSTLGSLILTKRINLDQWVSLTLYIYVLCLWYSDYDLCDRSKQRS